MKKLFAFACVGIMLSFFSCAKDEGEGGTATLGGYVYKVVHADDNASMPADTMPAAKEDVFIRYGNNKEIGDDMETSPDGYFLFRYLTKGTYTIYAYSTYASGEREAVSTTVHLGRGEDKRIPTIYIHEGKAYGTSMIKGKIVIKYYSRDLMKNLTDENGNDTFPAGDTRVYLTRKGESFVIDDVRTSPDGTFYFQKLPAGEYTVTVYTADEKMLESYGENISVALSKDIAVTEMGKVVEFEEIFETLGVK